MSPANARPAPPLNATLTGPLLASDWPAARHGWYVVFVLFIAYTFAYVDRVILTILVEPLQRDLAINDSQIALLHGLAFTVFYVGLGLPLGHVADRHSRRRLIVGSIGFWGLMTAGCGLARSFGQLFLCRIGVGVGEAGLSPASYSLLGDYFPPARRSAAIGAYTMAIYIGGGLALLLGGLIVKLVGSNPTVVLPLLGELRSWQAVFILVGLPGLPVALLALTVREPLRRANAGHQLEEARSAGFWPHLRTHRTVYTLHFMAFAFLAVPFNVVLLWARPALSRQFGLSPSDAAYTVGGLMMVCCTLGVLGGSLLADRLQSRGRVDGTVTVGLLAALGLIPPLCAWPFMGTAGSSTVALAFIMFFGAAAFGAGPSGLQLITPNRMRAVASALYLLCVNLLGLTVGPTLSGVLTDYVFKDPKAVGTSAAIVAIGAALISALLFARLAPVFRAAVAQEGRR